MAEISANDMNTGGPGAFGARGSRAMAYAGGALSLALIVGIAVWGVRLVLRDVNGIPVVQAVQTDARVRPQEPGGTIADHAGLSVNEVAAGGTAAPVAERVQLAPQEQGLSAEDMAVAMTEPAAAAQVSPQTGGVATMQASALSGPLSGPVNSTEDVLAMLDRVAAESGAAPLAPAGQDDTDRVVIMVNGQPVKTLRDRAPEGVIPASVPGVSSAPRPPARPAGLGQVRAGQASDPIAAAIASQVAAADTSVQVTPDSAIPVGTHMAQLSAPDSPEAALREWDRIVGLFPDYFQGRTRVIQKTERDDGRVFFRLRVSGFSAESDVRRFCSAVKAAARSQGGSQDCLPVQIR